LVLFAIMLLLRKKWNPFAGFTMPAYFVLYGVLRFIVEMYRGDHNPVRIGGLTDQQVFALAAAGLGVILFIVLWLRSRSKGARRTPVKQN
jgi:prolipoprotein diacylglyceryltransferase